MRRRIAHSLATLLVCMVMAACAQRGASATPSPAAPSPAADHTAATPGKVDFSCTTDADCAIKDIGNCCGTYPACVNRDSPTFPEQVKAQCAAEGLSSICGFPAIDGCQCVEGRCEGTAGASVVPDARRD